MVALRTLYLLALVFWIGGMVALGTFAAPAIFDVLETHHGAAGRLKAEDIFAEMLRRFRAFEYGSAVVLLGALGTLTYRGPRPAALRIRVATVVTMLCISLYAGIGVAGQIDGLQREMEANIATLGGPNDYAVRYDNLYAQTTTLLLINLGFGLWLIYWEAKAHIA
ncbi:MAG: DUF4149 domain-containing protein [Ilumatobacter sp.]|jgi:hypothetical protein|nr:DUF4149 domain-containing protein [Ilumatobacter sp.]